MLDLLINLLCFCGSIVLSAIAIFLFIFAAMEIIIAIKTIKEKIKTK